MTDEPVKETEQPDNTIEESGAPIKKESEAIKSEDVSEQKSDTEVPASGKCKPKKKKKKVKYIDDGHTVYSMEGLDEARGIKRRGDSINLSRKEKWAAIRAAFARFFPIFLGVVGCFSLTALLLYFWLR